MPKQKQKQQKSIGTQETGGPTAETLSEETILKGGKIGEGGFGNVYKSKKVSTIRVPVVPMPKVMANLLTRAVSEENTAGKRIANALTREESTEKNIAIKFWKKGDADQNEIEIHQVIADKINNYKDPKIRDEMRRSFNLMSPIMIASKETSVVTMGIESRKTSSDDVYESVTLKETANKKTVLEADKIIGLEGEYAEFGSLNSFLQNVALNKNMGATSSEKKSLFSNVRKIFSGSPKDTSPDLHQYFLEDPSRFLHQMMKKMYKCMQNQHALGLLHLDFSARNLLITNVDNFNVTMQIADQGLAQKITDPNVAIPAKAKSIPKKTSDVYRVNEQKVSVMSDLYAFKIACITMINLVLKPEKPENFILDQFPLSPTEGFTDKRKTMTDEEVLTIFVEKARQLVEDNLRNENAEVRKIAEGCQKFLDTYGVYLSSFPQLILLKPKIVDLNISPKQKFDDDAKELTKIQKQFEANARVGSRVKIRKPRTFSKIPSFSQSAEAPKVVDENYAEKPQMAKAQENPYIQGNISSPVDFQAVNDSQYGQVSAASSHSAESNTNEYGTTKFLLSQLNAEPAKMKSQPVNDPLYEKTGVAPTNTNNSLNLNSLNKENKKEEEAHEEKPLTPRPSN